MTDVERAACAALAEIRKLPEEKQGEAFVLAVKLVVEGAAIPLGSIKPTPPIGTGEDHG